MPARPPPIEILRCPATGDSLAEDGTGALVTSDGERRYAVVRDGVPILMRDGDSATSSLRDHPPAGRAPVRELGRRLLLAPPTVLRNIKARDNYRRLRALLLEQRDEASGRPRVLVVGGATLGVGLDELVDADSIEVIETDVAMGPRTRVLCDGHDLPFKDAVFDAAVCQAVLPYVLDPERVVGEIHRVLKPGGLVYSEAAFMQQAHLGARDFSRWTALGHRRLYRRFDEIASGAQGGPGMALASSIRHFVMSFARSPVARAFLDRVASLCVFWLKYFDAFLVGRPAGLDAATGTYFLGRRRETPVSDEEFFAGYRGAGPKHASH